jgi:hypothetical protein
VKPPARIRGQVIYLSIKLVGGRDDRLAGTTDSSSGRASDSSSSSSKMLGGNVQEVTRAPRHPPSAPCRMPHSDRARVARPPEPRCPANAAPNARFPNAPRREPGASAGAPPTPKRQRGPGAHATPPAIVPPGVQGFQGLCDRHRRMQVQAGGGPHHHEGNVSCGCCTSPRGPLASSGLEGGGAERREGGPTVPGALHSTR